MSLPSRPTTRRETYLSKIAGQDTQLPSYPTTREEDYLDYIAKHGGGGGGGSVETVNNISPVDGNVTLHLEDIDFGTSAWNQVQAILS